MTAAHDRRPDTTSHSGRGQTRWTRRLLATMALTTAAVPGQWHPSTYAGATLSQWLGEDFRVHTDGLPARFERPDRARALAAFGIETPARPFLHRVLRDDEFRPDLVPTVLWALSAAEDATEFAADLRARWQRHPQDGSTIPALLAADPDAWVDVSPVLRAQVVRECERDEPRRMLEQGIVFVVPIAAAADDEWRMLLQRLVQDTTCLPPLEDLPRAVREPAVLVPALVRRSHTSFPPIEWIGFVAAHPTTLAPAIPRLREAVHEAVERHAKVLASWRIFPDTPAPGVDLRPARLLGAAGVGQLPFLQGLLDDTELDLRHQGYTGIGQMARWHDAARAVLMQRLAVVAALPEPDIAARSPWISVLAEASHRWRDRAFFVEACAMAGPAMVAPLVEALDPAMPSTSRLALEALRELWGLPRTSFAWSTQLVDAGEAPPQLAPVRALLDADDVALRETALTCAILCARTEPIDAGELPLLADELAKASEPTPQLRVRLWQCWRDRGAWLEDRADSCKPAVREVVLAVARTSPTATHSAWPRRPPSEPDWRQRVWNIVGMARLADESPAVHRRLEQLASVDSDLFVRQCAAATVRDLAK